MPPIESDIKKLHDSLKRTSINKLLLVIIAFIVVTSSVILVFVNSTNPTIFDSFCM